MGGCLSWVVGLAGGGLAGGGLVGGGLAGGVLLGGLLLVNELVDEVLSASLLNIFFFF